MFKNLAVERLATFVAGWTIGIAALYIFLTHVLPFVLKLREVSAMMPG